MGGPVGHPESEIREHDSDTGAKNVNQVPLDLRMENNGNGDPVYIGRALPGTPTNAEGWQIRKLTYSGTVLNTIVFANGESTYDKVWDDRGTYSYP